MVANDADSSNDRAVAAVKTSTAVRCIDFAIVSTGGSLSGCDGLRCTFASVPVGTSITAHVKTDSLGFNKNRFVTLAFALSSVDVDYFTDDNQVADRLSIPKAPECDYCGGSGGGCFIARQAAGGAASTSPWFS